MKSAKPDRILKEHSFHDLNGKWIAYDIDGRPLGEVIYKKGVLLSRKRHRRTGKKYGNAK